MLPFCPRPAQGLCRRGERLPGGGHVAGGAAAGQPDGTAGPVQEGAGGGDAERAEGGMMSVLCHGQILRVMVLFMGMLLVNIRTKE